MSGERKYRIASLCKTEYESISRQYGVAPSEDKAIKLVKSLTPQLPNDAEFIALFVNNERHCVDLLFSHQEFEPVAIGATIQRISREPLPTHDGLEYKVLRAPIGVPINVLCFDRWTDSRAERPYVSKAVSDGEVWRDVVTNAPLARSVIGWRPLSEELVERGVVNV